MLIAPKISENDIIQTDDVQKYMHGIFEIQMIDKDLQKSWSKCVQVMNNQPKINEVILHTPFTMHIMEVYMMSHELEKSLVKLIVDCIRYSDARQIKIGILFHAELCYEFFMSANGMNFASYIESLIDGTNVYIIMENVLPIMSAYDTKEVPLFKMFKDIKDSKLDKYKICIDTCHLEGSENCLKTKFEIPSEILSKVHEIHFSAVLDRDGYLNKKETHGRVHASYEDIRYDMKKLIDTGVNLDELIVTAEISEDDYRNRPDMLKELSMLYKLKSEMNL